MHNEKLFDDWAKKYEADILRLKDQYPFAAYFDNLDLVIKEAEQAKSILDLGVGSGYMLHKVLESCPIDYFGLDFSEKMLEIAGSKLKAENLLLWNISDKRIPSALENRNFDLILSAYTLHHFTTELKLEIIQHYQQFLTEQGKFVIVDISFDSLEAMNEVKAAASKSWDEEEEAGYFIVPEFIEKAIEAGLTVQQTKTSFCSSVYVIG